mgnify:CR=1 FL=1|jgi:phosphate starvation-inducible PhoH-like protein|tara:strand:+ start:1278 stop:2036 length:759 start_codon:yes stop_codon:yes gene_type:complete
MPTNKKRGGGAKAPVINKAKDDSPYVWQRDKIKQDISIRELKWTFNQERFIDLASKKDMRIMFINGPAGTAKTLLASYLSLQLLNQRKVSDVCYLRSAVESSEAGIGFLPGSPDEKMSVYNSPFWDKMSELLNVGDQKKLIDDNRIHCMPMNYIRGLSWNAKAVIVDEAQNSSQKELVTTITRLGHFTRCFICADPDQSDLNGKGGGFQSLFNLFENDREAMDHGIYTFEFTEDDIMRSDLVKFVVKRLKSL